MASYIERRKFLATLGGVVTAWPLAARAQQPKLARIGFLGPAPASTYSSRVEALRAGLRDLIESPVIFPPGRARLAACPTPTGSAW
jgi:hypothetical protein